MKFTAWAIDTRSKEGHGLIGRYYFGEPPQPSHEGCLPSLFKTREIARGYLKFMSFRWHNPFPKARVIKVSVEVKEAK